MRYPKGRCYYCGKVDERTKLGRYRCAECAAKEAENQKMRYLRVIAEHRCITCGDQDERTLSGRIQCAPCAKFHAAKQRMRYREKRLSRSQCGFGKDDI